jgi:hypothetical protein
MKFEVVKITEKNSQIYDIKEGYCISLSVSTEVTGETQRAYLIEEEIDALGGKVTGLMRGTGDNTTEYIIDYFETPIDEFIDVIKENLVFLNEVKMSDISPDNEDLHPYSVNLYFRHPESRVCFWLGFATGWTTGEEEALASLNNLFMEENNE